MIAKQVNRLMIFHDFFCIFNISFFFFAQSHLTFSAFFWTSWFELTRALVVDSHGGITVATLSDVNLKKTLCGVATLYRLYI